MPITAKLDDEKVDGDLKRLEAIILSMTLEERRDHELINGSRKKRIAQGSGNSIEAINQLLKQFTEMRKMMKKLSKAKKMQQLHKQDIIWKMKNKRILYLVKIKLAIPKFVRLSSIILSFLLTDIK